MAEQSVPDSVPAEAMDAADEAFAKAWMNGADHVDALRLAVEAAAPILLAAGRAQAAADIRADLETVLTQRNLHSHARPGIWDADNRPEIANTVCVECAARKRLYAWLREAP